MKAGLTVGAVRLAVSTPHGSLEESICSGYVGYLGDILRPDCWLEISQSNSRATSGQLSVSVSPGQMRLEHPAFEAEMDGAGRATAVVSRSPGALDDLLTVLVAILAPSRQMLLVEGAAVVSRGRGHLLLGHGDALLRHAELEHRPIVGTKYVGIEKRGGRWTVSSTPFGSGGRASWSTLNTVWTSQKPKKTRAARGAVAPLGAGEAAAMILRGCVVPEPTLALPNVFDLAAAIAAGVPAAHLTGSTSWERMDELAPALTIRSALSSGRPELRTYMSDALVRSRARRRVEKEPGPQP